MSLDMSSVPAIVTQCQKLQMEGSLPASMAVAQTTATLATIKQLDYFSLEITWHHKSKSVTIHSGKYHPNLKENLVQVRLLNRSKLKPIDHFY